MYNRLIKHAYLPVSVGNRVLIADGYLAFCDIQEGKPGKTYEVMVVDVSRRFGAHNDGYDFSNPLVTVRYADGTERSFDNSYILEVLERTPQVPTLPYNYARENIRQAAVVYPKRGLASGFFRDLVLTTLAKLPFYLPNELRETSSMLCLYELAGCPGDVTDAYKPDDFFVRSSWRIVRRKQFERWVKQNAYRFCFTSRELHAAATRSNMEFEADYWRSVDREMEKDLCADEGSCYDEAEVEMGYMD